MGAFDTLWHLLNLFAPALAMGALAPLMARFLWRRGLKGPPWPAQSLWVTGGCAVALVAGLVAFGHDGRVITYGLMVLCGGLTLWVLEFKGRR
jgi:hypothetical protein